MNKVEVQKWFRDGGDNRFRYNYELNENSLVLDVGGYEGTFCDKIHNKYKCDVMVFEPTKKYYNDLVSRFNNNDKIKLYNFGLSDKKDEVLIYYDNDATSIHKTDTSETESIKIESIVDFINDNDIKEIDLLKLNIEGSEFEVLDALIKNGMLGMIKNIQVQFHTFIDNAAEKRDKIREFLKKTHKETYCYDFVWENWERL